MTPFVTSRTHAQDYLNCRRYRYWRTLYRQTGIEPVRSSIPLVVGSSVHAAIETILGFCITNEPFDKFSAIESAVDAGLKYYREECARRQLDIGSDEDMNFVAAEQLALIEAIIRGWIAFILPQLLEEYNVVGIEREDTFKLAEIECSNCGGLTNEEYAAIAELNDLSWTKCSNCEDGQIPLMWQSRADIDLQSKRTGDLYVASIKNLKQWGILQQKQYSIDMQSNSEIYAAEQARGVSYSGLLMLINVKGAYKKPSKKSENSDEWVESGPKTYASFLVHPWKKDGITSEGDEWAWTDKYQCTEPHKFANGKKCEGFKNHKLTEAQGWRKVNIWQEGISMKEWIDLLASGKVQGAGNPFATVMFMPEPTLKNKSVIDSWLRQVQASEVEVAQKGELINSLEEGSREYVEVLDRDWWQNSKHCLTYSESYRCEMYAICWEGVSEPLDSGLFQSRRPHHSLERALFTERGFEV